MLKKLKEKNLDLVQLKIEIERLIPMLGTNVGSELKVKLFSCIFLIKFQNDFKFFIFNLFYFYFVLA